MFLKFAAAAPLAAIGLAASTSYVVVDVKEADRHFVIPIPVVAAQAALAFAPDEAQRIPCPEFAEYQETALRLIQALREAPDGELVEVENGTERVFISKIDDTLEFEVHGEEAEVLVSLPLEAALEMVASYDGQAFDTGDVVAALKSVSRKDLVHVRTENEEVKVWIW